MHDDGQHYVDSLSRFWITIRRRLSSENWQLQRQVYHTVYWIITLSEAEDNFACWAGPSEWGAEGGGKWGVVLTLAPWIHQIQLWPDQRWLIPYSLHFRWFVQTRDRYLAVASRAIFCCRCSHIRISRRGCFIVKHLHSHPILSLSPLLRTFKFEYFVFNKEIGWIRPDSAEHSRGGVAVEGGEKQG